MIEQTPSDCRTFRTAISTDTARPSSCGSSVGFKPLRMLTSPISDCTLRAGDLVEVKSAQEILSTLDKQGTYESLPFMPEMLQFCGKRFRVFRRASKICDTLDKTGLRRMERTVLLQGVHCDGANHGGCEARCMMLWKERWLTPLQEHTEVPHDGQTGMNLASSPTWLMECTRAPSGLNDEPVYRCQITALKQASLPLAWWDLRQYVEDVSSGNQGVREVLTGLLIMLFNWAQRLRGGDVYPYMDAGTLQRTPVAPLNLQPGDNVRVKSREEILATLDPFWKNRGLYFDVGMARYCGGTFKVAVRASKVIHEKTGCMIHTSPDNPMIILDGVFCNSDYQKFCARSEYIFWREIWLTRA